MAATMTRKKTTEIDAMDFGSLANYETKEQLGEKRLRNNVMKLWPQ